jgi:glycosyltransferase involved in cell wall biosynthesis
MRVGVNVLTLVPDYDEEYVYLRRVLDQIRELQPDSQVVVFADEMTYDAFNGWDRVLVGRAPAGSRLESAPHERSLDRAIKSASVDLVYSPLQTALDAPPELLAPFVLDLGFLSAATTQSRWFTPSIDRDLRRVCVRMPVFIAPSEFVRQQMLRQLGVPMNKVIVAQPGSDPAYEIPGRTIVEGPYLITFCETRHREQVAVLTRAFERIQTEVPHALVVLGRPDDSEPDDWGPRVLRIHRCPVAQMAGLLQNSTAYICTSAHEGACLTLLEAMRAGARIISPRVGGLDEVAGKSPVYYNHESVGSLVSAIHRVLRESASDRSANIEYARRRAAEFTWERCAWRTLTAFKRVAPKSR